jgi:TolB protein
MYFKWVWLLNILLGVLVLMFWLGGESINAFDLSATDGQFPNGLNGTMNDSIDVEKIVFYSDRDGNAEIYIMNVNGSGLKRLTVNSAQDVCPALSPDGSKIAFVSNRDGNYEVYVMKNDGSNQQRLTNTVNDEDQPAWSPDGTKIFYIKEMGGNAAICVMNADGSGDTNLTNGSVRDERPNVSPNGTKIVFNSTRDGNYEIYFMDVDGSNQQRLTNSPDWEVFPTWSPDGNKIAYALLNYQTHNNEIHLINADGSGDMALTNVGFRSENPCWSPDGKQIVFQTDRDGNFEVYVMNSDGTNQHRITNNSSWDGWSSWGTVRVPLKKYLGQTPPDSIPKRFPPSSLLSNGVWLWHGSPVFPPDGMEMYFVKYISTTNKMEMYYMKIDQNGEWISPQRPSFASDSSDNSPVFTSDGNRLFFTSYRDGSIKIYRVTRTDTGWSAPELVNMDYPSLPGNLGWCISLTPDETMYFDIYTPGNGLDIYKSKLVNGMYSQFEKLPDQINSTFNDATSYINPDERYIIFSSNRPGGFGLHDLYISYKKLDGAWTPAQNMGNKINGSNEDGFPAVTPDGEFFFFTSAKSGDLGYNPYWVDASSLCKLGDANNNGIVDVSDILYLINYVFYDGSAPLLFSDVNRDDVIDIGDIVYLINHVFYNGPKPSCI